MEKSQNKILLICRTLNNSDKLFSIISDNFDKFIVASDDIRVHKAVKKYNSSIDTTYLERMESFYPVVDELLLILEKINRWLKSLRPNEPQLTDELYWLSHCEGGDTTQRILDLLLLRRSYLDLILCLKPNRIILIDRSLNAWEDELIFNLANEYRITISYAEPREIIKNWIDKKWYGIRPVLIGIYKTLTVLKTKIKNFNHSKLKICDEKFVAIHLPTAEIKHYNHSINIAKAFTLSGFQSIIIGWRLGQIVNNLKNDKQEYIEIETFISLFNIATAWKNILIIKRSAKKNIGHFLSNDLNHDYNTLRPILTQSMNSFIFSDFLERLLYKDGANNFFARKTPIALRPLSLILPLAVMTYKEAKKNNPNLITFMHGSWPYNVPNPISYSKEPIDRRSVLMSCSGENHLNYLSNLGYERKNIQVTGLHWLEPLLNFKKNFSKAESRKILNIKSDSKLYILIDPGTHLRGYMTKREQFLVIISFLEFASKNKDIVFLFKPHPSHISGELEEVVTSYELENVYILDHRILPYHAINSSDILITKASTLAIEAMYLNVPTMAIILDNEKNFECYGNAVEYYFSIDLLLEKITLLSKDESSYKSWQSEMSKLINIYFQKEKMVSSGQPAIEFVNFISSKLKQTK